MGEGMAAGAERTLTIVDQLACSARRLALVSGHSAHQQESVVNSCPIRRVLAMTVLAASAGTGLAHAQIAISANDAKVTLVDGVQTVAKTPLPDTITIIDLSASPPK